MSSMFFRQVATSLVALLLSQLLLSSTAFAAPPTNDELLMQVQQLKSQVQILEQRTAAIAPAGRGAVSTSPSIEAQVADLSAKVVSILQVLQITNQGVLLRSDRSLTLRAGDQLNVQSGQKTVVESQGHIMIRSTGKSEIVGAQVILNNGTKPVAFQGGQTAGGANQHIISSGSPTVLVP